MIDKNNLPQDDCAIVVIDERPLFFWDIGIKEKNLRFIEQIDSDYFNYIANVNFSILQNPDENEVDKTNRQHAAIAMRMAYSQALEVLFSFIFSAVQSPDFVIGWFLKYTNSNLESVVNKIRSHQRVRSRFSTTIRSWKDITNLIFIGLEETQKQMFARSLDNYSTLLAQFAQDFADDSFNDEYNSLKHGLRVNMGGFHLAIGAEDVPGVPEKPENMRLMAHSEFGTTFYTSEKIEETSNFVIHQKSRNWNPENYYHALHLISMTIKNVKVFLKRINGSLDELNYLIPEQPDFHRKPWLIGSRMSFGMNSQINTTAVPLLSKEEILSIYDSSTVDLKELTVNDS
jgi:hypothetical protein